MPLLYMATGFDASIRAGSMTETRRDLSQQKIKESMNNVKSGRDVHVTSMYKGIKDARYVVRYTRVLTEKHPPES